MSLAPIDMEKNVEEIVRLEKIDPDTSAQDDIRPSTTHKEVFPGITKDVVWAFLVCLPSK